jgi:hypothetical protein
VNGFPRAIASVLIVLASGLVAPEVWAQAPLTQPPQSTETVRRSADVYVVAATAAARFAIDSRVERERQARSHAAIPSGIAAPSPRRARLAPAEWRRTPERFARSRVPSRAPPTPALSL